MATGYLFKRLCDARTLEAAWKRVLTHYRGAAAPPELSEYGRRLDVRLAKLRRTLADESFLPAPASRIALPKPGKPREKRAISLVQPEDRIVLTALNDLLYPLFERKFSKRSYAYRRGRSALDAVKHVARILDRGFSHFAAADIDDFFDSIDRRALLQKVESVIWEKPIRRLLAVYVHMGVTEGPDWRQPERGIWQGSPLSPLLSNIALLDLDALLDQRGVEWVRYADNLMVFSQAPDEAQACLREAETWLENRLGLLFNEDSRLTGRVEEGFEFLGFQFVPGTIRISEARLRQKRERIDQALARFPKHLDKAVAALSEMSLGWRAYYRLGEAPVQLEELREAMREGFTGWLTTYRAGPGKSLPKRELRARLTELELPTEETVSSRRRFVRRLLQDSAPPEPASPPPAARAAIAKRRREHERRKRDVEDIVISRPGSFLGRSGGRLVVRADGKRLLEAPLSLVRNITVLTPAGSISDELMIEAAQRGITIYLMASDGRPAVRIGRVEAPQFTLTALQARLALAPAGLEIARAVVVGKIANQANLLKYYAKFRRSDGSETLAESILELERFRADAAARHWASDAPVDIELERGRLFALEGRAASSYWRGVRALLPAAISFDGRERRGARDLVNSALNYGYGILYSRAQDALIRAGLNVEIGFLHKPQPGKASLLYDFVEEFRQAAVDRSVIRLLSMTCPLTLDEGRLTAESRRNIATNVLRRLHAATRYRDERASLSEILYCQARLLAQQVEGKASYHAYVLQW